MAIQAITPARAARAARRVQTAEGYFFGQINALLASPPAPGQPILLTDEHFDELLLMTFSRFNEGLELQALPTIKEVYEAVGWLVESTPAGFIFTPGPQEADDTAELPEDMEVLARYARSVYNEDLRSWQSGADEFSRWHEATLAAASSRARREALTAAAELALAPSPDYLADAGTCRYIAGRIRESI